VAFVTGHDSASKRRGPVDWASAAHAADTLVVFMCARTIATVAADLVASGRAATTPVAIVSHGTWEEQVVYAGTLADLAGLDPDSDQPPFETPAIAIVGEVVALSERLHWFGEPARPLAEDAPVREMAAAKVG
jgi:siroheme synthase